jgi:hypothetical protein
MVSAKFFVPALALSNEIKEVMIGDDELGEESVMITALTDEGGV